MSHNTNAYFKEDKMEIRYSNHPDDSKHYTTTELRNHYLQQNIFKADDILLTYTHVDRMIFGGAMPTNKSLELLAGDELRAEYFLERRELGVINVGGKGQIEIDGTVYDMDTQDGIYVGMGNKKIVFSSKDASNPAKFYINSTPAHTTYPIVHIPIANANPNKLGDQKTMNVRTIFQYVHPAVCKSCQLTMGLTRLDEGSGWNTMPSHTHERRMEVYFYFGIPEGQAVFHMMGQPQETRHIVMQNDEAVISPSWSIHSGIGTAAYTFIWGMCGENQEFTDMDGLNTSELR